MREILPRLRRPSHHLGSEWNVVVKDQAQVEARVALAFPDLYEVGMSYSGQRILYEAVNRDPRFWAERVFAPSRENALIMREAGAPLASLESDTPLARLDAVAFSLTHELCYTNILYMLDLAGIPRRSADRDAAHPLILAGGGSCFNAEPVAPFFDAMVLGDGELVLPRILETVASLKGRASRQELLDELSRLPGVYVPALFEDMGGYVKPKAGRPASVEKAILPDLADSPYPTDMVVPFGQAVHDRLTIEIARGCTRGCRFCQAGMIYRPVRERAVDDITSCVARAIERTGFEEMSFLSLSTGDFSSLAALFDTTYATCRAGQVAVSLPSLRVGSLSGRIMRLMASIRRTGATLAPEAGSERLRAVINKGITEADLLAHTKTLFENGWQQVKLYFMIGLPTETPEDVAAILDLCLKVAATAKNPKRLQITAAVSPFVPKPHTPFQWERQLGAGGTEEIMERIYYLKDLFRPHRRLKLKWHEPAMSWLEGVFSRGDRRLAPVVERACDLGALFSSWEDELNLPLWREVLAEAGVDPGRYMAERDPLDPLPWDHLNCGVTKQFLLRERERALSGRPTPDCRYGACLACGVCNLPGRTSTLTAQAACCDIRPVVHGQAPDQSGQSVEPVEPAGPVEPVEPVEPAGPAGPEAPGAPAAPGPDLTERKCMIRLFYRKRGLAAYLSQLELQRIFERSIRRAGLPVSFSAGFHPMPLLSFGRALPVGVESCSEWVNLSFRTELDPAQVVERLRPCLPTGIVPFRAEPLEVKRRQPQAEREDFLVLYPRAASFRAMQDWEQFLAQDAAIHRRVTDKGEQAVNARSLVERAAWLQPKGMRLTLDWRGEYLNPLALIRFVHSGAWRPERQADQGANQDADQEDIPFRLVKLLQRFPGPDQA